MPINQATITAMINATKADLTTAQQAQATRQAEEELAKQRLAAAQNMVAILTRRLKALQQISTENSGS
jgi:hypothetical protein